MVVKCRYKINCFPFLDFKQLFNSILLLPPLVEYTFIPSFLSLIYNGRSMLIKRKMCSVIHCRGIFQRKQSLLSAYSLSVTSEEFALSVSVAFQGDLCTMYAIDCSLCQCILFKVSGIFVYKFRSSHVTISFDLALASAVFLPSSGYEIYFQIVL